MKIHRTISRTPAIQSPALSDWKLVDRVRERCAELESVSDQTLTSAALTLRENTVHDRTIVHQTPNRRTNLQRSDSTILEGCALAREAVRRVHGKIFFSVQLLAGIALARGCVAQMHTGEGKTLTSVIPAFINSLYYSSVHVATPNAYLAHRDFVELRGVFELLGLSVGLLPEKHDTEQAKAAYMCDVTYGAGYAFGFDFLRDELNRRQRADLELGRETVLSMRGMSPQRLATLQTGHLCSLIDEIDSVLLDEAMTPLVLSGSASQGTQDKPLLRLARMLADNLDRGRDFQLNATSGKSDLTHAGLEKIELSIIASECAGSSQQADLRAGLKRPWSNYVQNALQAKYILKPDIDYVVRDGMIQLVDQKTGRIFSDRSWRGGLHQAVEERAGVELSEEKQSLGRITRQSYYRMYNSLCGMTGTAAGAEAEFEGIYQLPTKQIPLNKPSLRINLPDRYFSDASAKFQAIAREAAERHTRNQPVLIGTRTIFDSEAISANLTSQKIPHVVLNGKQDLEEAEIIAQAGRAGHVTVATNMAGRGTDIKPDAQAMAAGGLHVICAERHDSRRIDQQLAGRAARAGARGSCQFFLSAQDALLADHAPRLANRINRSADASGESHDGLSTAIEKLQAMREKTAFENRVMMMQQDEQMNLLLSSLCYRTD